MATSNARPAVALLLPANERDQVAAELAAGGFDPVPLDDVRDLAALLGGRSDVAVGIIDAEVAGDIVKLRLTDPKDIRKAYTIAIDGTATPVNSINTGVPHVVAFVNDLDGHDVANIGRMIRYHQEYQPAGTNANFARLINRHRIKVRTYERGVEAETLACGTGAVASALVASWTGLVDSPVDVLVKSEETLKIYFEKTNKGFEQVYLEGGTTVVYQGFLWDEAYSNIR